jgi:branched-chain amino acid transport system permease protein
VLPLAVVILGGMDMTVGPIAGAAALRLLEEITRHFVGGAGYQVVYGAVIIVMIVAMPKGLVGALRQIVAARTARAQRRHPVARLS